MTALLRGELLKTVTTRTVFAYAALGAALAIANVLIMTLSGDLATVADKQGAIAGLPMLLILLGLVGAAGEYRTAPPPPPRSRPAIAAGGCYSHERAPTPWQASCSERSRPQSRWHSASRSCVASRVRGSAPARSPPWPRGASSARACARSWVSPPVRSSAARSQAWSAR